MEKPSKLKRLVNIVAHFQKKGEKVCNDPDVKKYGADMVKKCLKPYMETVKAGDQSKCKALL